MLFRKVTKSIIIIIIHSDIDPTAVFRLPNLWPFWLWFFLWFGLWLLFSIFHSVFDSIGPLLMFNLLHLPGRLPNGIPDNLLIDLLLHFLELIGIGGYILLLNLLHFFLID